VTFADLEKKIPQTAPVAAAPPHAISPVGSVEVRLRRANLLLLVTGIAILVVGISGDFFGSPARSYANSWIERTLVCEMYMLWLGMGALLAVDKPTWLRVPIVIGTVAVYLFVITHDEQFSMVPQAAWLLCVRLLPPGFVGVFANDNIKRVKVVTFAGLAVLAVQIVMFAMLSSALAGIGIGTVEGNVITAPRWFSGIVWGAYYIELAFLLPYVERNLDQFG